MALVMKIMKYTFAIIILLMMFIIFLLLHNSCNTSTRKLRTQFELTGSKNSLENVLRKAAMNDRRVIITKVSQSYTISRSKDSILDLFLESFNIGQGTKHLLNHLVIIALDDKAFEYCKAIHPHCFLFLNTHLNAKYTILPDVLELGYNFIYTDADVMWLRNPITQLRPSYEIAIACDFNFTYPTKTTIGGLSSMRSSELSIEFFKYWKMAVYLYPDYNNRSLCELTTRDDIFETLNLNIQYLGSEYFAGFCQEQWDRQKIRTVHANCCESIECKVDKIKVLLDDWRNFTASMAENS